MPMSISFVSHNLLSGYLHQRGQLLGDHTLHGIIESLIVGRRSRSHYHIGESTMLAVSCSVAAQAHS